MNIKSLPEEERPVEKAMKYGIKALSNAELIAMIIHTGTREKSAIRLAEEILSSLDEGVKGLGTCSPQELMNINGIGSSKACTLCAVVELGNRVSKAVYDKKSFIEGADDAANLLMEELRYEKKEHFKTILINTKGQIITVDNVSTGELSSTIVHPREVFSQAIRRSAAAVIFAHNHPSGDPTPSSQDIATTKRLVEAGKLLGIKVLDHIIIGDGTFVSIRSKGLMDT